MVKFIGACFCEVSTGIGPVRTTRDELDGLNRGECMMMPSWLMDPTVCGPIVFECECSKVCKCEGCNRHGEMCGMKYLDPCTMCWL
jgi:hypothetical protein